MPDRRMVLVHAHPDDETITCGGTMTLAAAAGVGVTLVTCTLGELGEVIPADLAHLEGTGGLADHRERELDEACRLLGVADRRFLGGRGRWQDSGMVATDGIFAASPATVAEGAFARPDDREEQVARLVEILDEVAPQVVISYDASGGYGHADHVRAHEITAAAVAAVDPAATTIAFYATAAARGDVEAGLAALRRDAALPVPVPDVDALPTVPDATITHRVPLGAARGTKLAALRAHATQISVHDDGREPPAYALSNGLAQPVSRDECFVQLRGPTGGGPAAGGPAGVGAVLFPPADRSGVPAR